MARNAKTKTKAGSTVEPTLLKKAAPEVWVVFPTVDAARANEVVPKWLAQGYRVAVLQDRVRFEVPGAEVYTPFGAEYRGYPQSVNWLCENAVPPDAIAIVAGDDMLPDPSRTAQEIVAEYYARFPEGEGVMQPTGDDLDGTDRICGSPWCGPAFRKAVYGGQAVNWPGYTHFFADEELFEVSRAAGVLWQNPAVTQRHEHWSRTGNRPAHATTLNSYWDRDQATFRARKAEGFPGAWGAPAAVLPGPGPEAGLAGTSGRVVAVVASRGSGWSIGYCARHAARWADQVVVVEVGPAAPSGHALSLLREENPGVRIIFEPQRPSLHPDDAVRTAWRMGCESARADDGDAICVLLDASLGEVVVGPADDAREFFRGTPRGSLRGLRHSWLTSMHLDRCTVPSGEVYVATAPGTEPGAPGPQRAAGAPDYAAAPAGLRLLAMASASPARWRAIHDLAACAEAVRDPSIGREEIRARKRANETLLERLRAETMADDLAMDSAGILRYLRLDGPGGDEAAMEAFRRAYGEGAFEGIGVAWR